MNKILVVGSVALDTITTPSGKRDDILGGSATFFSVSAAFFNRVNLVAVVGDDFPKKYVNLLNSRGVDTRGLIRKQGRTFRWEGIYGADFGDPRTIATHLNVFAEFDPVIPDEYKKCEYLFLANIDPVLQQKVLKSVKRPRLVVCDTMNYWIEVRRRNLEELLKNVDIFLLNEAEARQLSGEKSIVNAARKILKLGPERLIIKRGEHGSMLFSGKSVCCLPALLLKKVVDTTGAGDTFAGGVVGYLSQCREISDRNIRKALAYGTVMATFAVEDFSLKKLASIDKKDILKRLNEFIKLTRF